MSLSTKDRPAPKGRQVAHAGRASPPRPAKAAPRTRPGASRSGLQAGQSRNRPLHIPASSLRPAGVSRPNHKSQNPGLYMSDRIAGNTQPEIAPRSSATAPRFRSRHPRRRGLDKNFDPATIITPGKDLSRALGKRARLWGAYALVSWTPCDAIIWLFPPILRGLKPIAQVSHEGRRESHEYLNAALRSELTAVSQYWLHYRHQEDWGYGKIASKSRAESIEEMNHADRLIQRIIFPLSGASEPVETGTPLRISATTLQKVGERPARCSRRH